MEEKKVLNEEQEKEINGGSAEHVCWNPVTCPNCGSENVTPEQPSEHGMHRLSTMYTCNDCGYYWDESNRSS